MGANKRNVKQGGGPEVLIENENHRKLVSELGLCFKKLDRVLAVCGAVSYVSMLICAFLCYMETSLVSKTNFSQGRQ